MLLDLASIDRGDIDLQRPHQASPQWEINRHTGANSSARRIREARIVVGNKVVPDRVCWTAHPACWTKSPRISRHSGRTLTQQGGGQTPTRCFSAAL